MKYIEFKGQTPFQSLLDLAVIFLGRKLDLCMLRRGYQRGM